MKVHWKRIDASLLCFALVVIAAVPVAALRSKTYSVGYELGRLKSEEKMLRQRNVDLQSQLAALQKNVRENRLKSNSSDGQPKLNLPSKANVWRANEPSAIPETNTGVSSAQKP
ncbi:MAG: hypothetical protein RI953_736 [Pseudomonadota bacterium]|jgi:hypothetical protein